MKLKPPAGGLNEGVSESLANNAFKTKQVISCVSSTVVATNGCAM